MSHSSNSVAERYAEALLSIALEKKKEEKYLKDLSDLVKQILLTPELSVALSHPSIKRVDKQSILSEVFKRTHYEAMFQNFVRLLVDRRKLALLPRVEQSYRDLLEKAKNKQRVLVTSAQSLSSTQKAALTKRLKEQLSDEVILDEKVDPTVLGGLRVELKGRIYDSTIMSQLMSLRATMASEKN